MKKSLLAIFILLITFSLTGLGCVIKTKKDTGGGVFKSSDSGQTWVQKAFVEQIKKKVITINEVGTSTLVFDPNNFNILYLGTQFEGIYRTLDGGDSWQILNLPKGNYPTISIDPTNSNIIYTATGSSILKTTDGGENWETIYVEPKGQAITSIKINFNDTSQIYITTSGGGVLKSLDYGNNWTVLEWLGDGIKNFFLSSKDYRTIYVITNKGLQKSPNGGETWDDLNEGLKDYPGANQIHWFTYIPSAPDTLYIGSNYGLLKSNNGGIAWQPIDILAPPGALPVKTVGVNPTNSQEIYFTNSKIIYKTLDGGKTWMTIETFPSGREINYLIIDPENPQILYAGTYKPKK